MTIIRIAKLLGYEVVVLDDRPAFTENAGQAGADEVICNSFDEGLAAVSGGPNVWFVIVTRGHEYDEVCLKAISGKKAAYVGVMGSRERIALLKKTLKEDALAEDFLESIHAPIGLAIGAETPEEIAVSILAQMTEIKNQNKREEAFSPELLAALEEADKAQVMAVIVERKGPAPREAGTRMLIRSDGTCVGTIGGGCVEAETVKNAREMLASDGERFRLIRESLLPSEEKAENMACGGKVRIFLEKI